MSTVETASVAVGSVNVTGVDVVPAATFWTIGCVGQPVTTGGVVSTPVAEDQRNRKFVILSCLIRIGKC